MKVNEIILLTLFFLFWQQMLTLEGARGKARTKARAKERAQHNAKAKAKVRKGRNKM